MSIKAPLCVLLACHPHQQWWHVWNTVFFITRTQQLHAHPNKQKGELLIRPRFTFLQARTQHKSSLPLKVKSLTEALINTWCLKGPFILSHLQSKVGLFSFPLEMALYGIFMMGQLWRFLPSGCALESFLWAKVGLSLSTDPFTSEGTSSLICQLQQE